jgi:hypothetical protein
MLSEVKTDTDEWACLSENEIEPNESEEMAEENVRVSSSSSEVGGRDSSFLAVLDLLQDNGDN